MKKRNYINAIIEDNETGSRSEQIFKLGDVDYNDDMHVFAYLKSEKEIETLEHPDFKVIKYWKARSQKNTLDVPHDPKNEKDLDDFFNQRGKYAPEP